MVSKLWAGLLLAVCLSGVAVAQNTAPNQGEQITEADILWYEKAARQGSVPALVNLGVVYSNGWGREQDFDKARALFLEAANQGNTQAQMNLGAMYYKGDQGVEKNLEQARQWYEKAADGGEPLAGAKLGIMYWQGMGVERDAEKAYAYFAQACSGGLTEFCRRQ